MTEQTMQTGAIQSATSSFSRAMTGIYGGVAYVLFFVTFTYAAGFLGNVLVPKSIDSGEPGPFWTSAIINVALLGLFGIQHSVMARPGFKRMWTKIVPKPVERSTFVLFSSMCLMLLYWQWQPMTEAVWTVEGGVARGVVCAVCVMGWMVVFLSTLMISHFDLFGLRQVFLYMTGQKYTPLGFQVNGFYKYVRHPIMVGFMIAFWATPDMTVGHLLFAGVSTAYIMVALQLEERDLIRQIGTAYIDYKRRVYGLIPMRKYQEPIRDTAPNTAMGD